MEIHFPIDFIVSGTPVSLQASPRSIRSWRKHVKAASYVALPENHFWYEGPASVILYYFPTEPMLGDIDNIAKPVLDALKAHILRDDHQVERLVVQRFTPEGTFSFTDASETLERALTSGEPVLYIQVSADPYEDFQ